MTRFATKAAALAVAVFSATSGIAADFASAQGYGQYPGPGAGGGYARPDGPGAGGGYARPYGQGARPYGQGYRRYGQNRQRYRQRPRQVAQWSCQYGVRETNPRIKLPAVLIQFRFAAFDNGQAFGRGVINQQTPFQVSGRWQAAQGVFQFRGYSQSYGATQSFPLTAKIGANGSLHYNWTTQTGKVIALICDRQA